MQYYVQFENDFNQLFHVFRRIDTGDDNRISKEEFSSDVAKASIEKWVGPIADYDAEFDKIDKNSGNLTIFTDVVCK
jgi:hypothetical protein